MNTEKIYTVIIILAFCTALCVRIIFFQELNHSALYHDPILDSKYYHLKAVNTITGEQADKQAFFMSPLYPYFLAVIYFIGGINTNLVPFSASRSFVNKTQRPILQVFGL